jgi:hypothetical protein
VVADVIVCDEDVRLLFGEQLTQRQWQILIQNILVDSFKRVLALFRCFQQRVIAAAELRLQVAPYAVQRAYGSWRA